MPLNMSFSFRLEKKIKFTSHRLFFLLFFLVSLASCQSSCDKLSLTSEEHDALEAFFSKLLFQEGGAYTLFGDKPISFDTLSEDPIEEKEAFLKQSPHLILKNEVRFKENWETWERLKERFKMSQFLLFKRASPSFSLEKSSVFFVNIAVTAAVLKRYYNDFRNVLGEDFDPLEMVFEIQNDNSVFWQKVFARHDLVGILLGFGAQNAWLFDRVRAYEDGEDPINTEEKKAFLESFSKRVPGSNSLSDYDLFLPLPAFGCYAETESLDLIEKYERQRKRIRDLYKRKDIVEVTIKRLTSTDLTEDPDAQYRARVAKDLKIDRLEGGR
jgi:hypothetical protein